MNKKIYKILIFTSLFFIGTSIFSQTTHVSDNRSTVNELSHDSIIMHNNKNKVYSSNLTSSNNAKIINDTTKSRSGSTIPPPKATLINEDRYIKR